MEALLKEIQGEDPPEAIDEIILDKLKQSSLTPEDKQLLEKYQEVVTLSMNSVGLTTLENFPVLPQLMKLELNDNKFQGKDLEHITNLKELRQLSLCGNQIKSVEELSALKKLNNLLSLDLFGCPITESKDYTQSIFKSFPNFKILDGFNEEGEEAELDYGTSSGEDISEDYEEEEDEEENLDGENVKKRKREEDEESDEEQDEEDLDQESDEEEKKKPAKKRKTKWNTGTL